MLEKFEQNRMVQNTRNFAPLDKKQTGLFLSPFYDKALAPFLKRFVKVKQLNDTKI